MRQAALFVLALLLACLQHGQLAFWPLAPDLPLALAAWAMVDGDDEGVVLRPWLIGLARDLIAPGVQAGGDVFYTCAYGGLGLCFMPLRAWLFRSRAIAWGGWAFLASLVLATIDARLGGVHLHLVPALLIAVLTAGASMALGWLFGGLPRSLQVVRTGGA